MKESLFKRNQESLGSINRASKRFDQDDSGLFLGGFEVGTSDMGDPSNEINDDPRFRIRVVI